MKLLATSISGLVLAPAIAIGQPAPTPAPTPTPTPVEPAPEAPPPVEPAPAESAPEAPAPEPEPAAAGPEEPTGPTITVGGYVEANYQVHFQNPSHRITNLRGFDNRSRTFTLSNVALDVKGEKGPVTARIILQVGHTPSTYYLAETASPGTGAVNASGSELWKYVQAANLTAKLPDDWLLEAGLFPSPIGIEVIPIKDNFNWSRSNLFFGLPFYHTGVMLSRPLGGGWTGKLHVYNGWNTVVDNNGYPSVAASAAYAGAKTTAQLLYFGGIERPSGAPEGKAWRHLFDALAQVAVTDTVTVAGQADAGFEPNDIGTSWWVAAAVYGKLAVSEQVYAAIRADAFYEEVAEDGGVTAGAIFWPTKWLASGTATLAYQPAGGVSVRAEYRHDHADTDVFFGGDVATDPMTGAFIPDRDMQDTVTVGVTTWF
jgi:hypothetical protein